MFNKTLFESKKNKKIAEKFDEAVKKFKVVCKWGCLDNMTWDVLVIQPVTMSHEHTDHI